MFSVHYWYWNNKDNPDKKEAKLSDFWTGEKLAQLASIGEKVNTLLLNPGQGTHKTKSYHIAQVKARENLLVVNFVKYFFLN